MPTYYVYTNPSELIPQTHWQTNFPNIMLYILTLWFIHITWLLFRNLWWLFFVVTFLLINEQPTPQTVSPTWKVDWTWSFIAPGWPSRLYANRYRGFTSVCHSSPAPRIVVPQKVSSTKYWHVTHFNDVDLSANSRTVDLLYSSAACIVPICTNTGRLSRQLINRASFVLTRVEEFTHFPTDPHHELVVSDLSFHKSVGFDLTNHEMVGSDRS